MAASRFRTVFLLHGKGGWPGGSVLQLQELLQASFPEPRYVRPSLPHGREQDEQRAEASVDFLRQLQIDPGALVVGISLGGLVAAKLQETRRDDLHVICISSPTRADGVELQCFCCFQAAQIITFLHPALIHHGFYSYYISYFFGIPLFSS